MTVPHYVNEHTSDIRAIKAGWYGMESSGKLSSGPFQNEERCLTGITHVKGKFRASPWARTLKCPECGREQIRPCTRVNEYGREWIDNSCETCGHTLSLKEIRTVSVSCGQRNAS
jgi:predicted RNA-binding Zn-ribbon protein involved in translation (DUF1610 family)